MAITTIAMAVAGVTALTFGFMVRDVPAGGEVPVPEQAGIDFGLQDATLNIPGGTHLAMQMPRTWLTSGDESSITFTQLGEEQYGSLTVRVMPSGNASLESFAQAALQQEKARWPDAVFGAPAATTLMGLPALEFSGEDTTGANYRFIVVADAETQMMYIIDSRADAADAAMAYDIKVGIDSIRKG